MDVRLPNGKIITGIPDGTNKYAIMEKAINSGLATPEDFGQESGDPTGGFWGNLRAGAGKAFVDIARGVGQKVGLVSKEDVRASRRLDAPLMRTGGGVTGNIAGNVAAFAPTAFIPGANTLTGSALIGAGIGLSSPYASTREAVMNPAIGGAIAPASILAARGASALYRGGKAMIEPLFKGGQERVAARTLTAFAGGADDAQRAAANISKNAQGILPGVSPTTAELAQNPGLSQLERTLRNNPEFMTRMTDRTMANRSAMLGAIDQIAGDDAAMQAAQAARRALGNSMYRPIMGVTAQADDALNGLLNRPSMKSAWRVAARIAREEDELLRIGVDVPERVIPSDILDEFGKPFTTTVPAQSSSFSGKALHYLKMAMDDIADNPNQYGVAGKEAAAIGNTRRSFVDWVDKNIPGYEAARNAYATASKPINRMEIGQALRDKLVPALDDFGTTGRLRPQSFAQAVRTGDAFAARTLGRSRASIKNILSNEQYESLMKVGEQLARRASADDLGRAVGSNTGQNFVSQNVLRQFLGPLGLPESTMQRAAGSTFGQSLMRPAQWAGSLGEGRIMDMLVDAALDPQKAKSLLEAGVSPETLGLLRAQGLIASSSAALAPSASN